MILTSVLTAGAIGAATLAGPVGGGSNSCHLTWDKQCCPVPGCDVSVAPGVLTICNDKSQGAEFTWVLSDPFGMGLTFQPSNGFTGLAPGECIDLPFTIICPPGFPAGAVADYEATVTKVGTNEVFGCFGSVRNDSDLKIGNPVPVVEVEIPPSPILAGPRTNVRMSVDNLGSSGKDGVSLYIVPMGGFGVSPAVLPLPPIAEGASISDCRFDVFFDISLRGDPPQQTVMGDILYMLDTDGDNVGDQVIGSQTVRGIPQAAPCPGDINNDGVIDTADLGILIGNFGLMCP